MTDPTPPPISSVRGHIGTASASTSDLLDLLTTALAEDDPRNTTEQRTVAGHHQHHEHSRNKEHDEHRGHDGHGRDREGRTDEGGSR